MRVGNIGNVMMAGLGEHTDFLLHHVYRGVPGLLRGSSAGRTTDRGQFHCLTLSEIKLKRLYDDLDYFLPRVVLRPQSCPTTPPIRIPGSSPSTPRLRSIFTGINSRTYAEPK